MKTILKKKKHSVKIYFYQCDESKIWLESFFVVQGIHFLNVFEKMGHAVQHSPLWEE